MRTILFAALVLATPAAADMGDDAVQYCLERSDQQTCVAEAQRGFAAMRELFDWAEQQPETAQLERANDAIAYCQERYAPVVLAVGACMDGFLLDRR